MSAVFNISLPGKNYPACCGVGRGISGSVSLFVRLAVFVRWVEFVRLVHSWRPREWWLGCWAGMPLHVPRNVILPALVVAVWALDALRGRVTVPGVVGVLGPEMAGEGALVEVTFAAVWK